MKNICRLFNNNNNNGITKTKRPSNINFNTWQRCSLASGSHALSVTKHVITKRRRNGDGCTDGCGKSARRSIGDGRTRRRRLTVAGSSGSESHRIASISGRRTHRTRRRWWWRRDWWIHIIILILIVSALIVSALIVSALIVSALIISALVIATVITAIEIVVRSATVGSVGSATTVDLLLDDMPTASGQRPQQ